MGILSDCRISHVQLTTLLTFLITNMRRPSFVSTCSLEIRMETRFPDRIGSNDAVDAGFPSSKNTPLSLNRPEPNTRLTLPPFYPSSRAAYEAKTGIDLEAIHSGSRVAQVLVNPLGKFPGCHHLRRSPEPIVPVYPGTRTFRFFVCVRYNRWREALPN